MFYIKRISWENFEYIILNCVLTVSAHDERQFEFTNNPYTVTLFGELYQDRLKTRYSKILQLMF